MAKSVTLTVNDAGDPEQVVVQTNCKTILFGEDENVTGWPTVNWEFRRTGSTAWIGKTAGTKQAFSRHDPGYFEPGEVVADVRVKAGEGSTTFGQHEE